MRLVDAASDSTAIDVSEGFLSSHAFIGSPSSDYYRLEVPSLQQIAAVFTIVGGSLGLIQLTAILVRLNRRPRLKVRLESVRKEAHDARLIVVLHLITTNSGTLSARNILWNYDFPLGFRVMKPDEHHERMDRVTVARALEQLHPRVETHHELAVEAADGVKDFELRFRVHLEDLKPQVGTIMIRLDAAP